MARKIAKVGAAETKRVEFNLCPTYYRGCFDTTNTDKNYRMTKLENTGKHKNSLHSINLNN